MLVYQMIEGITLQNQRIFVETAHPAGNLHTTEQVDSNVLLALQSRVQVRILNVNGRHDWRNKRHAQPAAAPNSAGGKW